MNRVLVRTVLVWLMLLAIPFQGIAAAAMLTCAHAAGQARQHAAPPAQVDADAGHCHQAAPPSADDAAHGQPPDTHDHDSRCSACAACCMGAAMAPTPTLTPAVQSSSARLHAAPSGRLAAVDLALPERPPRLPLA